MSAKTCQPLSVAMSTPLTCPPLPLRVVLSFLQGAQKVSPNLANKTRRHLTTLPHAPRQPATRPTGPSRRRDAGREPGPPPAPRGAPAKAGSANRGAPARARVTHGRDHTSGSCYGAVDNGISGDRNQGKSWGNAGSAEGGIAAPAGHD